MSVNAISDQVGAVSSQHVQLPSLSSLPPPPPPCEQSPVEQANNWRLRGNKWFRAERYDKALQYYKEVRGHNLSLTLELRTDSVEVEIEFGSGCSGGRISHSVIELTTPTDASGDTRLSPLTCWTPPHTLFAAWFYCAAPSSLLQLQLHYI